MKKTVGISVEFLRKPGTGIGEVTRNFVRTLCELCESEASLAQIEFILYAQADFDLAELLGKLAPANVRVRSFLPFWRRDDLVRKIWWELFSLPQMIARDGCDVFISLYQSTTILRKIKHIMVVHDIIPELFPQYVNNLRKKIDWTLVKKAIGRADKIVSVSECTRQDLLKHFEISPQKVVTAHIDCDQSFREVIGGEQVTQVLRKYDLNIGEYIYFGGGLDLRKNAAALLRVYAKLRKLAKSGQIRSVPKLVISGKLQPQLAPLVTDIEKLVGELEIAKSVQILGFVPAGDLPALYRGAQFFVYPSLYEGFGLPVLEALAVAAPVVASRASSVSEVVGEAALYFDPADEEDILRKMQEMIESAKLRKKLSNAGPPQASKFSWSKFTHKVLAEVEVIS